MMHLINRLFDLLIDFKAVLGRLLIVLMAILVFIDVITLQIFDFSLSWIFEVNEHLLLFITFLGATFVLRRNEHIKMDLILNLLNKKQTRVVELVNSLVGMIVSLIMTVTGFMTTMNLYEKNILTEAVLSIPRFLIVMIIPIGFLFLTIQFLRMFIFRLKDKEL